MNRRCRRRRKRRPSSPRRWTTGTCHGPTPPRLPWPTLTPQQAFESLIVTGARDFRDIGHKAIFAANAFLHAAHHSGRQHAEPVLRSLAYAQLKHEGDNPAKRDGDPDRPGEESRASAADAGQLGPKRREP